MDRIAWYTITVMDVLCVLRHYHEKAATRASRDNLWVGVMVRVRVRVMYVGQAWGRFGLDRYTIFREFHTTAHHTRKIDDFVVAAGKSPKTA
jgi:hypothetical protein